jgi:hypothetical protein
MVLQIDEFLRQRNEIHASYTTAPPMKRSSNKRRNKGSIRETKEDAQVRDKKPSTRDRPKKNEPNKRQISRLTLDNDLLNHSLQS